jgi:hypothetical protein
MLAVSDLLRKRKKHQFYSRRFIHGTIQNAPIGLVQRIAIIAGWVWVSLLAIALLRKGRAPEAMAGSIPH